MNAFGRAAWWAGPALSFLTLAPLADAAPRAADLFIGTLEKDGGDIILRRCDLAENQYVLVDAPGSQAMAAVRASALPAYGEVIASYAEQGGRSILHVERIDGLTPGKNCHLLDAVDDMFKETGSTLSSADTPPADRPDQAFAGHYYLSGVRETGSELLLDADGTFQWFLSYGAVDQTAQGTWHRAGDTLVLIAAMPKTDKPLFAYVETEPWSKQAEEERRQREHDEKGAAIRATCPFLTDAWVSTPTAIMVVGNEPAKPPADVLRRHAAETRAKAIDLRTRVEMLARQLMGKDAPPVSDAGTEQPHKLLADWLEAKEQARLAAREAALPDPAIDDPTLPVGCTIPPLEDTSDAPTTWRGGIGARVFDRASEQGARDVRITLRFADGHEHEIVTAGRGLALLPGKPTKTVVGATLHAEYAKGRDASFTFAAVTSGILHFSIDAQQLAAPPFTMLRLKISDGALIPELFGRGRYERRP